MAGRRGGIAVLAALAALAAGCGEEPTAADFDPTVAEEFVRNKARADLRANPILLARDPKSPNVKCNQRQPASGRPATEDEDATFVCDVAFFSRTGERLGRQTWRTVVELDPQTGDTIVRSSLLLDSTIASAR